MPYKLVWWGGSDGGGFYFIMWSHQLPIGLKLGCGNIGNRHPLNNLSKLRNSAKTVGNILL